MPAIAPGEIFLVVSESNNTNLFKVGSIPCCYSTVLLICFDKKYTLYYIKFKYKPTVKESLF